MNLKERAAAKALTYIKSGMVLGLGTGSTTAYFVDMLGEKVSSGELTDILGIPTSKETAEHAAKWGIEITTLSKHPRIDIAIDGADEVDPTLNLIKGLGRALLREKIVEIHAEKFIVIVDASKMVSRLGTRDALPIEILPFEAEAHIHWLNALGCRAELWLEDDGSLAITDNGNYLSKCWFEEGIPDAYNLAQKLSTRPGIIEHGLFLDMATEIIIAKEGGVEVQKRKKTNSGV
ncbi:MAG: ribose 5-phosphate isomerase A [Anaerolineae bacterium]|jgi:ribose 5-phosphate isomerase A|nr:ribose 5-phosphate isomerase A [Anaerolineae bacterium]MBT7074353.1 ribose 5-phosphate isomerase A [Anaerolineae bacterium]MBT7781507.1 ribose 5-phosphate isomerase A [Anaerolineae bacterium]